MGTLWLVRAAVSEREQSGFPCRHLRALLSAGERPPRPVDRAVARREAAARPLQRRVLAAARPLRCRRPRPRLLALDPHGNRSLVTATRTGDHRLFCSAAAVAPAWYPSACEPSSPSPTRKRAFTSRTPTAAARFGGFASTHRATLVWTHDGRYLISVSSQGTLTVVSHSGRRLGANHSAAGIDAIAVAKARDAYAVAGHGGLSQSTVVINDLQSHRTRCVFSGRGRSVARLIARWKTARARLDERGPVPLPAHERTATRVSRGLRPRAAIRSSRAQTRVPDPRRLLLQGRRRVLNRPVALAANGIRVWSPLRSHSSPHWKGNDGHIEEATGGEETGE